jgi:hypothetical protein
MTVLLYYIQLNKETNESCVSFKDLLRYVI